MSNDKTTELPIPADMDQLFSKAASDFVKGVSVADYNRAGMAYFAYYQGRQDEYVRHLHSLPPSLVGEAGKYTREELRENLLEALNYGVFLKKKMESAREGETGEDIFNEWFDDNYPAQPASSRAGEISSALRWVKASERLPTNRDNPWNHFRLNGTKVSGNFYDPVDRHGPVFAVHHSLCEDYDIYEKDFDRLEWLEEIPPICEYKSHSIPFEWPGTTLPADGFIKQAAGHPTHVPDHKTECTCICGPTDANPNCEWPNCFMPEEKSDLHAKGDIPKEIAGDNLREWAIVESMNLAQRDKDFFFLGVGQLWERFGLQIAALTQGREERDHALVFFRKEIVALTEERDQALNNLQKMIDELAKKNDEAVEYRNTLLSIQTEAPDLSAKWASDAATYVLNKYPNP